KYISSRYIVNTIFRLFQQPANPPSSLATAAAAPLSSQQDPDSLADRSTRNEDAQHDAQRQHRADQADQGVFKLRAHLEDEAGLRPGFGVVVQGEDQRHQNKRHVGERGPEIRALFGAAQVDQYFGERRFEITHGQDRYHQCCPDTRNENRNAIHFPILLSGRDGSRSSAKRETRGFKQTSEGPSTQTPPAQAGLPEFARR